MDFLRGKRVLVTGGTGSFGNFIVRRLLDEGVREVRVFSRDEKKQYDMRVFYGARENLSFQIGDIRDPVAVRRGVKGVDVVFQAAALKQVPTCESFPMEAVRTNVMGVENLVEAALAEGVERFVTISTDKAVKPVNVMGMTKALQERLVLNANNATTNEGTRFAAVRYGNVLRSRGSVIPFFRRQLAMGKRITITDERMTRFLLTLNDAIDLVLFAARNTTGGEVFVRKAPAARIVDLAAVLAKEAGVSLEYDVTGILPGEKLNEILISEEELERSEDMGDYYKVNAWWTSKRPRAVHKEYSSGDQLVGLDEVERLVKRADEEFERMELGGGEFAKF